MKNIIVSYLIIGLLSIGIFSGCKEPIIEGGNISIEFLASPLNVDLNVADNSSITCVVTSEVGLKSISMFILKTGNVEEPFKNTIQKFYNSNSYSIFEKPVYQEDMTGFKVVAQDLGGNTQELILPIGIKPMLNAPTISFVPEQLSMKEGDLMPTFSIMVSALSNLKYITISKVVNRKEVLMVDTINVFSSPRDFTFKSADYPFILFGPGTTGVKIQAVDQYNKIKIALLPVNFTELAPPTVQFNGPNPLVVNELSSGSVSGTVSSSSGLEKVGFYLVGPSTNDTIKLDEKILSGSPLTYLFTTNYTNIPSNTNGFMVRSQDKLGKISKIKLPIKLNILFPAPTIDVALTNFNAVDLGSTINLSGQIASGAGLATLTVNKINNFGESSLIQEYNLSANNKSVSLSNSIVATADLTKIQIIAIDMNGKTTKKEITGTVGYYLIEKFEFGSEKTPLVGPGGFFSVPLREVMTIDKAFTMQDKIDFSFYVTGNPAGVLRICGISTNDLSASKYVNIMSGTQNVGVNVWTKKNVTKLQKTTMTDFDPANFNKYTIDYIKSFEYAGSTISDMTTNNADFSTPNNFIVWFQTVDHGNGSKKGIIKYEGISPNSLSIVKDTKATFLLSIKIEK